MIIGILKVLPEPHKTNDDADYTYILSLYI